MKARTLERTRYSPDLLARVAGGWRTLAERERLGVVQAARITTELTALGAPPSILALAGHLVRDKARHLQVCGTVLEGLDVPGARAPRAVEMAISLPRASVATEASLARTLVSEFALGKPVTAAAFASARAVVREPLFAWAYTELLHDETRHATFGAKAAAWVVRHWSLRQREALWAACLAETMSDVIPLARDREAESLGLLPAEIDDTLPRWILPHLAPLGVSTHAANDQALIH
ncbi:MAG TPA: hypothetical protein VHJ20_08220 [Polyangia bacterium]|nr:hypothetical protein [Polyangia bacterium]